MTWTRIACRVSLLALLGAGPALGAAPAKAPAVGDTAPDFTLNALDGGAARLSALTAEGPLALVVLRGYPGYQCPICTRMVGEYLARADEFAQAGARVVFVYPGPAEGLTAHAEEFVRGRDYPAHFRFLLDPDFKFTHAYGLRWDAPQETAYPSTFVLDRAGRVAYAKVSTTHGDRAPVADVLAALGGGTAAEKAKAAALAHSVEQLRGSIGRWNVTTEFLDESGSIARTAEGTYEFTWVVPDRVVSGRSEIPAANQASGILFYVNEKQGVIEMVSVGADGRLWTMTGPLGGEVRTTPEFDTAGGGKARLRFTRYNVEADRFESKMEYSEDGGATWKPGNHQVFRRAAGSPAP